MILSGVSREQESTMKRGLAGLFFFLAYHIIWLFKKLNV